MEASDAEAAHEILRFALFKEVVRPERRKKRKLNTGNAMEGSDDESGEGETDNDEDEGQANGARMSMPASATQTGSATAVQTSGDQNGLVTGKGGLDDDVPMEETQAGGHGITSERLNVFRARFGNLRDGPLAEEEGVGFDDLLRLVNQGLAANQIFGAEEGRAAVEAMSEANQVFISDDVIYPIS